jgi:hypothetical protein
VFFGQTLKDPPGGVALLARGGPVGEQPLIDQLAVITELWCRPPSRALSRWRQRRRQRLSDGAAMDAMAGGKRPDR